jgi:S-adenosylmethionine/arginine decarboxylase-like enzyme
MEFQLKDPQVQIMACWVTFDEEDFNEEYLLDYSILHSLLEELVKKLDMVTILPPIGVKLPVVNYVDSITNRSVDMNDSGFSFITVSAMMIDTSHIVLHTWSKFRKAFVEVASCKPFEESIISDLIKSYFPACKIETRSLLF